MMPIHKLCITFPPSVYFEWQKKESSRPINEFLLKKEGKKVVSLHSDNLKNEAPLLLWSFKERNVIFDPILRADASARKKWKDPLLFLPFSRRYTITYIP